LKGRQSGYTVIEMMMVIVILGILTVAINQTIAHTVRISSRGTESMTAIKQMEDAFKWIDVDAQQSQKIKPALNSGFPLKFSWIEWDGTQHEVTYSFNGTNIKRHSLVNTIATDMLVAKYMATDPALTNGCVTGSGSFDFPDTNDAITFTGGPLASTGTITINSGGLNVTTTGTATYNSGTGAWSTPHTGDTVVIRAQSSNTKGFWAANNTSVLVKLTQDADGDAILNGNALILTLSAYGGEHSTYRETRQGLVFSRS
jgi:prepilin-type N-terminal cleavage/methylation domain-containing protein